MQWMMNAMNVMNVMNPLTLRKSESFLLFESAAVQKFDEDGKKNDLKLAP